MLYGSNGRRFVLTGQMEGTFPFLRDIAWRVQGTCSNSGDRSTANYLLNNTGTRELHTSASLGYVYIVSYGKGIKKERLHA